MNLKKALECKLRLYSPLSHPWQTYCAIAIVMAQCLPALWQTQSCPIQIAPASLAPVIALWGQDVLQSIFYPLSTKSLDSHSICFYFGSYSQWRPMLYADQVLA